MSDEEAEPVDAISIDDLTGLEESGPDRYTARPLATRLTRTFGGQVAAHAVAAAVRSTPQLQINSLHAYFLRAGRPQDRSEYVVDRVRDGRTFATRRVSCWQGDQEIFTMIASFHRGDRGFEHQAPAPEVPWPEELDADEQGLPTRLRPEWALWDQRWQRTTPEDGSPRHQRMWIRYLGDITPAPSAHQVALTYVSDMGLVTAAHLQHPGREVPTQDASLDHAVWFHRPFRVDEWLLFDQTSPTATAGRAWTTASVYDRSGVLVASVTQEALVRDRE